MANCCKETKKKKTGLVLLQCLLSQIHDNGDHLCNLRILYIREVRGLSVGVVARSAYSLDLRVHGLFLQSERLVGCAIKALSTGSSKRLSSLSLLATCDCTHDGISVGEWTNQ